MTQELRLNLTQISLVVGVLAAIAAIAGAWFILPYRVSQAEHSIRELQIKVESQGAILIRIDENVKNLTTK